MRCRNVLTRLDAMRTGELPREETVPVHEHLSRCSSCGESVGDLADLATAVKTIAVPPPADLRAVLKQGTCDSFDVIDEGDRRVFVAFTPRGLRMLHAGGTEKAFHTRYSERFGHQLERHRLPDRLRKQVVSALSGEGVAEPVLDLAELNEFERKVLEVLTQIPRGEVRTYSWVAKRAGRPKAIRAVGNVCARNVVPFVVPCHRVVPTTGGIGNYAFGSPMKRDLLAREGAPVDEIESLARERIRFIGSRKTRVFCCPTCHDAKRIRKENRVAFHGEQQALTAGFRPCKHCKPAA